MKYLRRKPSYSVQFDWDTSVNQTKRTTTNTLVRFKTYINTVLILIQRKWKDLLEMVNILWMKLLLKLNQFYDTIPLINRNLKAVMINTTFKPSIINTALKPSMLQSLNFDAYVKINVIQTILSTGVVLFQHLIIILFYYYYFQK